ncbi:hypothetical protein FRC07_000514 [Ceratobasidium sp. 392]|nr:hypothetical protein FRC07_000514 [Ceratobasidium sp. 392]
MPSSPQTSPATKTQCPFIMSTGTTAGHFVDSAGLVLLLRGVNLSGSSEAPINRPAQCDSDVWDTAEAGGEILIGGKCDYKYIEYTIRFGFKALMDPHQDIWSRFSGGCGTPYWTLLACGLHPPKHYGYTCRAPSLQTTLLFRIPNHDLGHKPQPLRIPDDIHPPLCRPGLRPRCIVDGVDIQDRIQRHFINALGMLAGAIKAAVGDTTTNISRTRSEYYGDAKRSDFGSPGVSPPPSFDEDDLKGRAVDSAHFYDALTNVFNSDALGLVRENYSSVLGTLRIGTGAVRNVMRHQLGILKNNPPNTFGPYPTIISETGIPINMHSKRSYTTGDYTNQTRALDCNLNAAEGSNVLNWMLWNHLLDNTHQWGDGWNLEDFLIWRAGDAATATPFATPSPKLRIPSNQLYEFVTSGARGVGVFSRRWPIATFGTLIHLEFNIEKAHFEMRVQVRQKDRGERADEEEGLGPEVYIPLVHFATNSVFEGKNDNRLEMERSVKMVTRSGKIRGIILLGKV